MEEDLYVIYAKKNKDRFKIVSHKSNTDYCNHCTKLTRGGRYNLVLHSGFEMMRESAPIIDGVNLTPQNYLDIQCFRFGKDTYICIEPQKGIYDLYFCENLDGLFLKSERNIE